MEQKSNLNTAQVLIMMNDALNDERKKMLHEKYFNELHYADRYNLHRIIAGNALMGAKRVIIRGGNPDEVDRALVYLQVCIDSMKFKLDWQKCAKDLEIAELFNKYTNDDD